MSRTSNRPARTSVLDVSCAGGDGEWVDFALPWVGDGLLMLGAIPASGGAGVDDLEVRTSGLTDANGDPLDVPNDPGVPPPMVGYFNIVATAVPGATIGIRGIGAAWSVVWFIGWTPTPAVATGTVVDP